MNKESKEIKFVRMRDSDDIIGWVTYDEECIIIEHPLLVDTDTILEESKQLIYFKEYLPQAIVGIKEIEISNYDIMFVTPVNEEFKEQYLSISDFFYNNKSKIRSTKPKKKVETTSEENVISIMEAILDKKNKPVH